MGQSYKGPPQRPSFYKDLFFKLVCVCRGRGRNMCIVCEALGSLGLELLVAVNSQIKELGTEPGPLKKHQVF